MLKVLLFATMALLAGCDFPQKDKSAPEKKDAVEKAAKELTPAQKLEFSEKCSKSGQAYFVRYRVQNLPAGFLWDEPEFHYSARLNTCLVYIRFVHAEDRFSQHINKVIDIFANKVLLQGEFTRDEKGVDTISAFTFSDAPNFTTVEFFYRKGLLFAD